jgi:hypothetical protein
MMMKHQITMLTGLLTLVGCGSIESPLENVETSKSKKDSSNCANSTKDANGPISAFEEELMTKAQGGFGERNTDLCYHSFKD